MSKVDRTGPLTALTESQAQAQRAYMVPRYDGIVKGAHLLLRRAEGAENDAWWMRATGIFLPVVILGAGILVSGETGSHGPTLFWAVVAATAMATFCYFMARRLEVSAIMLHLQAELALAQRDVAMNSFAPVEAFVR